MQREADLSRLGMAALSLGAGWARSGDWTVKTEAAVLSAAGGRIAFRLHARDHSAVGHMALRRTDNAGIVVNRCVAEIRGSSEVRRSEERETPHFATDIAPLGASERTWRLPCPPPE